MATMLDTRMIKAKQAWKVLQVKLISLGWIHTSTRIELFAVHFRSELLYICSVWGETKLDSRDIIGVGLHK